MVFVVAVLGLVFAYLGVATAAHWPPFELSKPPAFVAEFDLTEGVKAADDIERLVAFLDRAQTKIVFLKMSLPPDVARIEPREGAIKSIHFKPTCWLAQHSRIKPRGSYPCDNVRLDLVGRSGDLDLGTARWLTIATAHIEGYFRVGLHVSAMGYNRIQMAPVLKPG